MTDQEEFDKVRRRLYAIADRMGMRLTIIVRRKNPNYPAQSAVDTRRIIPPKLEKPVQREPGEN
jgi:hypothetical protein